MTENDWAAGFAGMESDFDRKCREEKEQRKVQKQAEKEAEEKEQEELKAKIKRVKE